EKMIDIGVSCLVFIDEHFRSFIFVDEKINCYYINLFQKMFTILANDNTAENKKLFDSAADCASKFIFNANTGNYFDSNIDRRNSEKIKIFSLLIKDKTDIQERINLINLINYILSSTCGDFPYNVGLRLTRKNWDNKLKLVLDHIDYLKKEKKYSQQHALSLLNIIAIIQNSPRIKISNLNFINYIIDFIKQIENNILLQDLENNKNDKECPIIQFIKTIEIGSRGYINEYFNKAIAVWPDVFKEPFELFKNKRELFNLLIEAFKEISMGFGTSEEKELLNWQKGIKIPVETVAYGAIKIIKNRDDSQAVIIIQKLKKLLSESQSIFNKNVQFDIQNEVNLLFVKIKRKSKGKGKLLPSDLDELLKLCSSDL
ncbi:MAG: hypothetical protein ACD_79C00282G0002, partial [uncultured bacterium]